MKISRRQLRRIIVEISTPLDNRVHMTVHGEPVPFGCEDCVVDIENRIADAVYSRDQCSVRSADRHHYNGLLNLLRRDKRAAVKEFNRRVAEEVVEEVMTEEKCRSRTGRLSCE